MSIPDSDLTRDAFLGGRLHLWQPRRGYRAGIDPLLLAAAVPARPGQSVLDLGTGIGTALFCLAARAPGLALSGVELQEEYAELARRNAAEAGIAAEIVTGDVARLPDRLRARRFDHVMSNPPYFDRRRGTRASDAGRETALGEGLGLAAWVAAGSRRLAPGGRMTLIQKADRAADLLAAMSAELGSLVLRPIRPRAGRDASLVIAEGIKGGRAPARIAPALILHDGAAAMPGGDDFSAAARAILRDNAPLA